MIEPYYYADGIWIYHGDSRLIVPQFDLSGVSLLLCDPPYGIDQDPSKFDKDTEFTKVKDDDKPFDPTWLLDMHLPSVIWGANCFAHMIDPDKYVPKDKLPSGGWICFDKTIENEVKVVISDGELAWSNLFRGVKLFRHLWSGAYRASEPGFHVHPTQKPVALMRWVIELFTEPGQLVLDPYMGSGPVAQACAETGRRYLGVEWEEKYCDIAVKRLSIPSFFGGA